MILNHIPTEAIQANKHRKENSFLFEIVLFVLIPEKNEIKNLATLRIYGNPNRGTRYACFWLWSRPKHNAGFGEARYSNGSAMKKNMYASEWHIAAVEAISKAGFLFENEYKLTDYGSDCVEREIFPAIAQYFGYGVYHVHKAHG